MTTILLIVHVSLAIALAYGRPSATTVPGRKADLRVVSLFEDLSGVRCDCGKLPAQLRAENAPYEFWHASLNPFSQPHANPTTASSWETRGE